MLDVNQIAPERLRSLRRNEYDVLVENGLFADERVELLAGALVEMTPPGAPHADAVGRLTMLLAPALVGRAMVRVQSPLALSEESEPEPDLAVVPQEDYRRDHPRQGLLLVEVAETSLRKDLGIKAALYAAGGVREYWVLDVATRAIHVHRDPSRGGYKQIVAIGPGGSVALQSFPDVVIRVDDVLPP